MSFIVFSIHQEVTNAAAALLLTRELTAVVVAIRRKWNQTVHFFLGGIKDNIYKLENPGTRQKKQRSILSMKWLRRCAPSLMYC